MVEIMFTVKSMTNAQKMQRLLNRSGIRAEIIRPDIKYTQSSCAYAVKISEIYFAEAVEVFSANGLYPNKIFAIEKNEIREIYI